MILIGSEYKVKLSVVVLYNVGMDQILFTCFYGMIEVEDLCEKGLESKNSGGWKFQENKANLGINLGNDQPFGKLSFLVGR